jgi:chaperonin GroEL
MSKQIYFDDEARGILQKGLNMAADAVGSTLGAKGRTAVISSGYGHMPIMTKDGVTVARSIILDDEIMNAGAMLVRYASEATVEEAGDGTTTSAILLQSMVTNGLIAVKEGASAQEVKSGMEKGVKAIVAELKKLSVDLDGDDMIKSIATVSANNDPEIGEKLAEAYGKLGSNGLLTIEPSKTPETYVDIVDGSEMQNGYANNKFVTDKVKMEVVYENPIVLVLNFDVKHVKDIAPFMVSIQKKYGDTPPPIIIVARGFAGEVHNTFVVNCGLGAKVCLVEAPIKDQRDALSDLAAVVGANMITDDAGKKVEHARLAHAGTCKKIIITKASTYIVEGAGEVDALDEMKRKIQLDIDDESDKDVSEAHEARLARVSGSVGVIYVGGATSVERNERKDRVDDSNKAIKSAFVEGVVPGGGVALMRAASKIGIGGLSGDEVVGLGIVFEACQAPLKKMLENAGVKGDEVFSAVFSAEGNSGYNLKTGKHVDMVDDKIIDPTKVVRAALENSASVAAQLINSSVLLIEMKPKE